MYLTSYDGTSGEYKVDGEVMSARYKKCVAAVRDCPENRQGVHEGDLSSYKDAEYFDAYIDTFSCMHIVLDELNSKELTLSTQDKAMKPLDVVRPGAYDTLAALNFEPITVADFNGVVEVRSNGSKIIVKNTGITIPGVLAVSNGTKNCTQQVNIGEITCMKYETNNFNFFQYENALIKISKDFAVEDYITLKSKGSE